MDRHAAERVAALALTGSDILLTGPANVDKKRYAEFAHQLSRPAASPFVSVNCVEIARRGWEDALFSQMEGTATRVPGIVDRIAAAEGGTLFLDEVHSLSLPSQLKLLRFLQEKRYRRLAETSVRRADVRLIAATSADLSAATRAGRFRADLFARFPVVSITVPFLWRSIAAIHLLLSRHIAIVWRRMNLASVGAQLGDSQ